MLYQDSFILLLIKKVSKNKNLSTTLPLCALQTMYLTVKKKSVFRTRVSYHLGVVAWICGEELDFPWLCQSQSTVH